MKKNTCRKVFSVLLALTMLLPLFSLVGAAAVDPQLKKDCPEIYIHGFIASRVALDVSDPDSEEVFPPSTDEILDAVKKAIPALAKLSVTRNYDKFADELIPIVNDLFYKSELDEYGNPRVATSGVDFNPRPSAAYLKSGGTIRFCYDWRVDPMISADQLNDFIQYVLETTGAEKVTLTAHSLGGVIMLAYLTKYGLSSVKSVCFNTTAVFGETYTGELLSGKIRINGNALRNYIKYWLGDNEYEYLLGRIVDMITDAGLMDFVARFGNHLIDKIADKVVPAVAIPFFAHWLTIWAMIPDEYYDDCIAYVFDDMLKDSELDYSVLREKIEKFRHEILDHKKETLNAINNNKSVNLYVISKYGFSSLPLTPSFNNMSDGVIDTKYSSFGATTAEFGKTLSDEIITRGGKYVNPEKNIDASTCMFPDQTWFINHYKHEKINNSLEEMMDALLYSTGQATVESFQEYPQYLSFNAEDNSITEDEGSKEENLNFFQRIKKFFSEFFRLLSDLFSMITK